MNQMSQTLHCASRLVHLVHLVIKKKEATLRMVYLPQSGSEKTNVKFKIYSVACRAL